MEKEPHDCKSGQPPLSAHVRILRAMTLSLNVTDCHDER